MTDHQSNPPPDLHADRQRKARADARKLLERRRQRIRIMRKRAIAGSVAAFAVAWAAIGFQLVTGNDPALSKSSKAAAVASTSTGGSKKSAGTKSVSKKKKQQVAPVTTQQS